jgi:hypothetical protein
MRREKREATVSTLHNVCGAADKMVISDEIDVRSSQPRFIAHVASRIAVHISHTDMA